ncbi:MAG: Uma2 family endonuclease [Eubacterium sp.]|nr:Uma2 family endonuclease [Eubacterium sp.]
MTIEEMKKRKKELGYTNKRLSEISGVPVGTIQKILSGETVSPRFVTIESIKLALTIGPSSEVREPEPAYNVSYNPNAVHTIGQENKEIKRVFGRVGDRTMEEYIALPEGTRVEMIDGVFYDMPAPTTIHQSIGAELWAIFKMHISKNGGKCVPFIAPTDVQLDCDDKTMVQPDVLVVCDRSKITRARIVGAPDLIVEVVSPSNPFTDVMVKFLKYKWAGVREYWIVFPDEKRVSVYNFEKSVEPVNYTFDDTIPVGIWDGKCEIDFKYIYSQVEFMYER